MVDEDKGTLSSGHSRAAAFNQLTVEQSLYKQAKTKASVERGAEFATLPGAMKLLAVVTCSEMARQVAQWKITHPRKSVEQTISLDAFKKENGQSWV